MIEDPGQGSSRVRGIGTAILLAMVLPAALSCGRDPREAQVEALQERVEDLESEVGGLRAENNLLQDVTLRAVVQRGGRTVLILAIASGVIIATVLVHAFGVSRRAKHLEGTVFRLLEERSGVETPGRGSSARQLAQGDPPALDAGARKAPVTAKGVPE